MAAFVLDGKYHKQTIESLIDEARQRPETLHAYAHDSLAPPFNASYNARVVNVDSHLD